MTRVIHAPENGPEREIDPNAVDYGNGSVMVQYLDNNETAIVRKSEIVIRK